MVAYLDEYAMALGRLHSNLLSLELMIRVFLSNRAPSEERLPPGTNLLQLRPGDALPETYLTDWSSLRQLVSKYNAMVDEALRVPLALAELRDAFAHGRVLSADADGSYLRLIRFARPSGGRVVVEAVEVLTKTRLSELIQQTFSALNSVRQAMSQPT